MELIKIIVICGSLSVLIAVWRSTSPRKRDRDREHDAPEPVRDGRLDRQEQRIQKLERQVEHLQQEVDWNTRLLQAQEPAPRLDTRPDPSPAAVAGASERPPVR